MTEATRAGVGEQIGSFAEGDLEYATDMLSALWEIASKDSSSTASPNPSPGVSSFICPLQSPKLRFISSLGQTGSESCSLGLR